MTYAVLALLLALVFHTQAACSTARQNDGRNLPHVIGPYRVRPTKRARRAQTAGWLLSMYAALTIADSFWPTQPWLGMGIAIAVIWGSIEQFVPIDGAAEPAEIVTSTTTRSGLWTPGPINIES